MQLTGIHHLTAVTADAPRNHAFYTRTLGMRLVKKTVNQDDTSAYHLFYADGKATPGTDLTFFDWPVGRERRGTHSVIRPSRSMVPSCFTPFLSKCLVYAMDNGGLAAELHVAVEPNLPVAQPGAGGVHHVAFRVPDAAYQAWVERLRDMGILSSGPVVDRRGIGTPFWGDRHPIGTPRWGPRLPPRSTGAALGMLVVETIAKIRRAHFVQANRSRRSAVS